MRHRLVILLVACVLSNPSAWLRAAGPAPLPDFTPWDVKALEKAPVFEWLDRSGAVHSLLYEAEPYGGKKTRVFAYYASPATLGLAKGAGGRFPGMVLVHGGGGMPSEAGPSCMPGVAMPPSPWTWAARSAKAGT